MKNLHEFLIKIELSRFFFLFIAVLLISIQYCNVLIFFLCVFFFFCARRKSKGEDTMSEDDFSFTILPFYILFFRRFSFKKLRHRWWKSKDINPPEQVNNQIFFYGHLFISLIGSLRSWVTLQHIGSTFASRYAYGIPTYY